MVGLAYASVPLYRLFCQVTGFGGTTQRADSAPAKTGERMMTIRFDANIAAKPALVVRSRRSSNMDVKLGEQKFAYYRATNTSDRDETTGTAPYST